MKETKKAIPFVVAGLITLVFYFTNPSEDSHIAVLHASYVEKHPWTGRATWWNYRRTVEYQDFLFFSVVKRNNRPVSIGIVGFVYQPTE